MGELDSRPRVGDRGGGIFVRGGFRLKNFGLIIDPETGDIALPDGFAPEVRTDIFPQWLDIAERAASDAEEARVRAVATDLDDNDGFDAALHGELRASMVAVAAAAFALDAFYAGVVLHAPDATAAASGRDAQLFETFKRAFAFAPGQPEAVRGMLRSVYRIRDKAVHPPADWNQPVLHTGFNLGMEPKYVMFRAENAINAHAIAQRLIHFCLRKPKPEYKELQEWCRGLEEQVPEPPVVPKWAEGQIPQGE